MSDFKESSPTGNNPVLLAILGGFACVMIVGLLIALLWPFSSAAPEARRRMTCTSHVKIVSLAMHNYYDAYKSLPPAYTTDEDGKPLQSWRVLILPFIEEQRLYDQIRRDEPWDSEYNKQFHDQMPSIYVCDSAKPDAKKKGLTSYMRVVGPETSTDGPHTVTFNEVTAGLSNVIGVLEVIPTTCWMAPVDIQESDLAGNFSFSRNSGVGSTHPGGINIGIMDGSVHFTSDDEASQLKDRVKIKR